MIYDCFPFFNELDLLEIRLNELAGVVDRFVLVEAELTHNGDPKPLHFAESADRFAAFADRIIHVVATAADMAPAERGATFQERAWMRENIQRNAIARGLAAASPDDAVMVSDLDEIPRASAVREAAASLRPGEVVGFALNAYNYFANLRNASEPVWGNDPKMATVGTFRDEAAHSTSKYSHFVLPAVNRGPTATRFRYIRPARRIRDAGWHFTYLGGAEAVAAKVRAFNETGLFRRADLDAYIRRRLASGKSLCGGGRSLPEPLDESFPAYLVANREKFSKFIIAQNTPPPRYLWKYHRCVHAVRQAWSKALFSLTPKWVRTVVKKLMGIGT